MAKKVFFPYKAAKAEVQSAKAGKIQQPAINEELTGFVHGKEASDIEERFAKELDRRGASYYFREPLVAGKNLPGWVELDFMVYSGGLTYPVQLDGEYAHKTAMQRQEDAIKDAIINDFLQGQSMPVKRISGDELQNEDDVKQAVKEVIG